MKVVIKVNQLEAVLRTSTILQEPIRASVKLRLQKIYKAVEAEYLENNKLTNDLIAQYGDPIPSEGSEQPDKQSFKLRDETRAEFDAKYKDIHESVIEFELQSIDMNMLCTDASGADIVFKGNYNLLLLEELFSEK